MKVSHSSINKYRLCPRKYKHSYLDGYEPDGKTDPKLVFGSVWHNGLERYWNGVEGPPDVSDLDENEAIVLVQMHKVYAELYEKDAVTVNACEAKHRLAFGPHTLTVILDGHITVNQHNAVVESKTTRADIQNDWYWMKLDLDHQIGLYVWAANEIGLPTESVVYDVVRVPSLKRGKDGRKNINGETLAEFTERCYNELTNNHEKYFQRRLHKPNVEKVIRNVEQWLRIMSFSEENNVWPMNETNCKAFGRLCEYYSTCAHDVPLEENNRVKERGPRK